ncbi:hypothetical protein SESBI_36116 [Sesbania bispinosa]|nr:hypothetical protein SESBI_36116 [Sesbania bispinosa]
MSDEDQNHHDTVSSSSSSSALPSESEEELQHMVLAPVVWKNRKRLSKQFSMCDRDRAWERRRRQERMRSTVQECVCDDLTDEDLHELKGCIYRTWLKGSMRKMVRHFATPCLLLISILLSNWEE